MEFEGIVIRRTSYKEGSAMISVLSNDRIHSFLAKGVLKINSKNAPSVNLFTRSRFQIFKGEQGDFLRVGEIIDSYPNINKDFEKLAVLDFISEITNTLLESSDTSKIYDFLVKTLECLNSDFSIWTSLLIYFAHVLQAAGYGLDVDSCAKCGNKHGIISFSYKEGGFICENCFNESSHVKYDSRKLKILRYIFKVDIANFDRVIFEKEESKEIFFELVEFLNFVAQLDFKSVNLLKQI